MGPVWLVANSVLNALTTGLPGRISASSAALLSATRAPVAAAASAASFGSRDVMMTSWPDRPMALASAVPTLPAPMIATFIAWSSVLPGHLPGLSLLAQQYAH